MTYQIVHKTEYVHQEPVALCHNLARLFPRNTDRQFCKKTFIQIDPEPSVLNEYEDFFGNKVVYFAVQHEHIKLAVMVNSEVEKKDPDLRHLELLSANTCDQVRSQLNDSSASAIDARQFVTQTPMTEHSQAIQNFALEMFHPDRPLYEAAWDLMGRIHKEFEFLPGFTTTTTPVADVMRLKKGVCQDFAHLAISCLRSVGLPARYVSGYIETLPPEGKEKLTGVDASHAWISVFIPPLGWVELDPTNNMLAGDRHVTIGWGRDYADVAPLKGIILSSGTHQLTVSVDVKRSA